MVTPQKRMLAYLGHALTLLLALFQEGVDEVDGLRVFDAVVIDVLGELTKPKGTTLFKSRMLLMRKGISPVSS
jgi:hypothetical protein